MTWTLRVRGAGGMTAAEYRCPVHGTFERMVERDERGDPPPLAECLADDGDGEAHRLCGRISHWTITSFPGLRFPRASFFRGKAESRGNPLDLDTRPLAEGMSMEEWKAKREKVWRDHDYAEFKRNT